MVTNPLPAIRDFFMDPAGLSDEDDVLDDGSCEGCKFLKVWTGETPCQGCTEENNLYQPEVPVEKKEFVYNPSPEELEEDWELLRELGRSISSAVGKGKDVLPEERFKTAEELLGFILNNWGGYLVKKEIEVGPDVEDVVDFPKLDGAASGLSAMLGTRPKFVVLQRGGLHCLYMGSQDGPYIWGFTEQGEAHAMKEGLNRAMFLSGCTVPNAELTDGPDAAKEGDGA